MNIRALVLAAVLSAALLSACSDKDDSTGTGETATPADSTASTTATGTATTPGNGSTPTSAATTQATATPTAKPSLGAAEHIGANAFEHIRQLSEVIGTREAGGAGDRAAIEYIRATFAGYGYDVEVMEFEYEGDRFRAGSVSAGQEAFDSFTMNGSPGGSASGTAVYVGLAREEDFAGKDVRGKVVLADRGDIPFAQKIQSAQSRGAVAIIVINNAADDFIGNGGEGVTIPAVGVSQESGAALMAAAASGAELTLEVPGIRSTSWNVIARPAPGATCSVLVGGHHDSVASAPGALDNASGTATTLELARAFAADGIDAGLCFVTFGAEESGLFGSDALAERMAGEGTLPEVFLNLDMTGLGDAIQLIGSAELVQQADSVAEELDIEALPHELAGFLGSDHQSFREEGVPVLFLTTDDLGKFHTPEDTIDTIDPDDLERCGDLAYAMVKEFVATFA
ncbi:MAG: M20/M25/M40 family metallo-hydrolase [Dehalococcoidia bacterium]|nr:M20/M25/M40 family metallo-hydrolase [Dehalococcoidia bacterium]